MGSTWVGEFDRRIEQTSTLTTVIAYRMDGRGYQFKLTDGQWVGDEDISDRLERITDSQGNDAGWRYQIAADGSNETFDLTGKLLTIESRTGLTQTLAYDANNRLLSVTDSLGRSLGFTYDTANRISTVTDPAGQPIRYAYDAAGNLASVTYPDLTPGDDTDNPKKLYHYEDPNFPHALTGITDENGVRYATWQYDYYGRAISSEHAGGAERVDLTYNPDGTTTVTDALGTDRTHGFETVLGVVKGTGVSQPAGSGCAAASSAMTHDANGNVATRDDFNGHRAKYWYDQGFATPRNLETTRVEGLGLVNGSETVLPETRTLTTAWHATWRLPTEIKTYGGGADANGQPQGSLLKTETLSYDAATGNLLRRDVSDPNPLRPETRTTNYTWHTLGRLKTVDGPRTDVSDLTTYDYYPDDDADLARRGQLWKITNALNHVTEILAYDLHGHPTQVKDPNGLISQYTYTPRGWLDTRLLSGPSGGRLTRYTYDKAGQLTRVDLPDGDWLEYTFDAAHRLTDIRNARGDHLHDDLDGLGHVTAETVTDAQGVQSRKLTRQYDALGRLWKDIRRVNGQDAITEYGHDAQGNPYTRNDPLNHASLATHDALDRLARTEDALQGHTDLTQNPLDDLTRHSDPRGLATTFDTDAFGQVRGETSPDRGTTTATYDPAGNLKTRTDARGKTLTYSYDALNRLTKIDRPTGTDSTYTYDAGANGKGRLTGMTDESGNTAWTYNEYGEVTGKTQTHIAGGALTRAVGYTYLNGRLTRLTYPSGAYVDYTWSQGRISALSLNGAPLLSNLQYQPFGPARSWTWGNGQAYARAFDPETGWPLSYPLGSNTRTLQYDAAGRITVYDYPQAALDQSFGYDALDRLTSQTTNQGTTLWNLDGNGNRLSQQSGASLYPYAVAGDSNRLQSVAGPVAKTYQYDAAGNITQDGTYGYTYNDAGRLGKLTYTTQATTYLYNGEGLRVHKAGRGATNGPVRYVYDGPGKLLGEYDKTGATQQETVWLDDLPVAVLTPGGNYTVHADHLNAPRVLLDSTNRIVWKWDGDPFGVGTANPDPDKDGKNVTYNLRLPGQYYDSESGGHYNAFRDYDPRTGRYIEFDPIGLAGGANGYAYVGGNPLSYVDPLGLFDIVVTDYGGRNGPTYGGMMTVLGQNGQSVTVPVSSWPNPSNPSPGVAPETYFGTYGPHAHQGRKPGVRVNNGGQVQTLGPNPAQGGAGYATGVNIHCGYKSSRRGSTGCVTVDPLFCKDVWDVLQPGETGVVTITR